MEEFAKSVNEFLAFRRYEILPDNNKGKISKKQAEAKAEAEYLEFNKTQKIESDFDRVIKQIEQSNTPTIRNFRRVQKDNAD
jgi:hypothetical protein